MIHMDHRAAAFSISTIFPSHYHRQGAESLSLQIPKNSVCTISNYIQRDYARLTSRAESSEQAFFSIQRFWETLRPDKGGTGWRLKIR